jgi:hypothetical protein
MIDSKPDRRSVLAGGAVLTGAALWPAAAQHLHTVYNDPGNVPGRTG